MDGSAAHRVSSGDRDEAAFRGQLRDTAAWTLNLATGSDAGLGLEDAPSLPGGAAGSRQRTGELVARGVA